MRKWTEVLTTKTIDEKISQLEQQLREAKAEKERISLENPTTIGGRIDRVMRIKGVTQTALSKEIGYTHQTTGRYLNNQRKISAEAIGKIAKILDVSCDYLILDKTNGGEGNPRQKGG